MSAAEKPIRHEFKFTMGEASQRKLDDLMARCGHTQLNLTVARALSLLTWVEDESDQGRVVGSIRYGEELDFRQLEERPELLRPRPRPQLVPASAPVAALAPQPQPTPEPEPVAEVLPEPEPVLTPAPAESKPAAINPKLVAREKVAPVPNPNDAPRERGRRLMKHKAYKADDNGPVKTIQFLRANCKARGYLPPIEFGEHALPGNLYLDHMDLLTSTIDVNVMATHFQISNFDNDISFCGYLPNKGWCYLNIESHQWEKDHQLNGGVSWAYPVIQAIEYLRRQGKHSPESQKYNDNPPDL